MTLYPALNDMNTFELPAYAPGYVAPTAPAQEEAVANVNERTLRSKVARAVAIAFVTIAVIAVAGFIVAGVVVAPILFVGAILAAVLLTAASTKTTKYHTTHFNSLRMHRSHGRRTARHHEIEHAAHARRHHEIGSGSRSAFTPATTFVTPATTFVTPGGNGGGRPAPVAPPTHVTRDGHVVARQRR